MAMPAPGGEPAQPIDELDLEGKRVLLLDDDPVLLRAWSRTLSQHGMIVLPLCRIHEAREALLGYRTRKRKLHYALIDDRLPDGFGLDLVATLSDMRPAPAFAVVSAHPSTERALRAWQRQIVIVPKPVSPTGLLQLMSFLATNQRRQKRQNRSARELRQDAMPFGPYVLGPQGLLTPDGMIRLTATGIELLAQLVERGGTWMPTLDLARQLYAREDPHTTMVVRRHISLVRRALGEHRWLIESELQRGYRIAPHAFSKF